jgi:8-oxo-dGTP pyrophosphatase MutT (NUDIX family)
MAKEQAFFKNGLMAEGTAIDRDEFDESGCYQGTVHVWLYRKTGSTTEVLLQKRAATKPVRPGEFDISAAGHIDEGESPIETAVRETCEKLGLVVAPDELELAFVIRKTDLKKNIATVYLYKVDDSFTATFTDDEVESILWTPIDEFKAMTVDPARHLLAEHGNGYYAVLIERLERV